MRGFGFVVAGALALARAAAADPAHPPSGVSVGVEAGQPTAGTVGWAGLHGLVGAEAAVGSGAVDGHGLYLAADLRVAPLVLVRHGRLRIPLYLGVGARRYEHHYKAASIDEMPDVHVGIDGLVGLGAAFGSGLELVIEGGPGWDLSRTPSCNLQSGVDSVCPHAQSSRAFWTGVVMARWWL